MSRSMSRETSALGSATLILTLFALISKSSGFIREILFANYYGTSQNYDWFLVTSVFPITLNSIALYFYQNYFIPAYTKHEKINKDLAVVFTKKIFLYSLVIALLSFVLLFIFRIQILKFYIGETFVSDKIESLFIIFICTVPLGIISGFLTAYSQTKLYFKSPAIALLLLNLFTIIALLTFKNQSILYIAIAYLAGSFVQMIVLLKVSGLLKIISSKIDNAIVKPDLKNSLVIWIILIEVIGQFYILSDRYFLNKVDEGGIASINYATTIFTLPISIITISLTTAIIPFFSKLVASDSIEELKVKIKEILTNTTLIFVPVTILFIFFGNEVIRILFERGSFNSQSTKMTSQVLMFLSLSLLIYSMYGILNKLFYVFELVKTLFFITILGMIIKFILNFVLVDSLKQNGLVISTSVSYFFFFVSSVVIVRKKLKLISITSILKFVIHYFANAFFSLIIVKVLMTTVIKSHSLLMDVLEICLFLFIYFITNYVLEDSYQKKLMYELKKFIPLKIFT